MSNAYAAMKKKCPGPSCPGCSSAACMADGGKVAGVRYADDQEGVQRQNTDKPAGESYMGTAVRQGDYSGAKKQHYQQRKESHNIPKPELMAEGGEVEGSDDGEALVEQCAAECMKAIESGDKTAFRQSLEALVSDIVMKMQEMPDVDGT